MTQTAVPELVRELEAALADGEVVTDGLDEYAADTYWKAVAARAAGTPLGLPDVVVLPSSDEDVAATLEVANRLRVPVVPRGGGSGSQGGAVPVAGGIVLDLARLDRIVDVDETSLTVTAEAGVNGLRLEQALNERGLMLPHYPASADLATVGGYVAARGSGVLSTRYGKIEDLVLALRVVLPTGETIDTVPVPRHAVGPELTQLFVGSEGTLGVITRATLQLAPLPAKRRFEAVSFADVGSGIRAVRDAIARRPAPLRRAPVRRGRDPPDARPGGRSRSSTAPPPSSRSRASPPSSTPRPTRCSRSRATPVRACSTDGLGETWWSRRYEFYKPPHHPTLPSIWGTIEAVATYARIEDVYAAVREAMRPYEADGLTMKIHLSHWYPWGTMIYGRFVVPDGGPDALALHDRIWEDGVRAILGAGGVMNDHHGVGLKLAPYMRDQHGAALDTLRRIKEVLDPNRIMNPGKLDL